MRAIFTIICYLPRLHSECTRLKITNNKEPPGGVCEDRQGLLDHNEGPHGGGIHSDPGALGVIDRENDARPIRTGIPLVGTILEIAAVVIAIAIVGRRRRCCSGCSFQADPAPEVGSRFQVDHSRGHVTGRSFGRN